MFDIQRPITDTDIAYRELEIIDAMSQRAFEQFKSETNLAYDLFWGGRTSPTLKAQLLWTKLLELFTKSAQAQAFIKSIEPDYEERWIPEWWEVNWKNDGSWTIAKKPLVIPE